MPSRLGRRTSSDFVCHVRGGGENWLRIKNPGNLQKMRFSVIFAGFGPQEYRPGRPAGLDRPDRAGPVPDSPKMIPPNRPGTYLIRRALKNDSDPCDECLKRSHERQVMKVFVQRVIRNCFANNFVLLRRSMVHGSMVPFYHGTMLPCYHGIMAACVVCM